MIFGRKRSSRSEQILILGLGGVGFYLAKRLIDDEHSVTIIEADANLIARADGQIDARIICGDAMSIKCWQEAFAASMDYMIAVTDNDAVNMMAARIADRFGIKRAIARIRSLEFGQPDSLLSAEDLKLDLLIHPEELVSQEVVRLIQINSGNEIIELAEGEVQLLATDISNSSPFAGKTLQEISQNYNSFPFRAVAIARGIRTIIPHGQQKILPGDHITFIVCRSHLEKIMELTATEQKRQQKVILLGGGAVGCRVAGLLGKTVAVTLLEQQEERAQELSGLLEGVELLHGDGSTMEILTEAGVQAADTFVACTEDNETNIMTSLLAKHLYGLKDEDEEEESKKRALKTIALVNKEDYLILAATTGTDVALNKKVLAANEIVKFIRRREFRAVAHLHGFDAEVVELVAEKKASITQKPLSKLDPIFRDKLIIGAICREGKWLIAVGDTQINAGEPVIVICPSNLLKDVRKLFIG